MKENIKIINTPIGKFTVVKEPKKFKALDKFNKIIETFNLFVKSLKFLGKSSKLENLSEDSLSEYIKYLKDKKVYYKEAKEALEKKYSEKIEMSTSDIEENSYTEAYEKQSNSLDSKIEKVQVKLEDAKALENARNDALNNLYNDLDENDKNYDEDVTPVELDDIPEIESPIEEEPTVEVPTVEENADLENKIDIDLNAVDKAIDNKEDIVINTVESDEVKEENTTEEQEKTEETPVVEEEKAIENEYNEYNLSIKGLSDEFNKQFAQSIGKLISDIREESQKLMNIELNRLSETAKQQIAVANKNTQEILNQKALVEQSRDEFKANYEAEVKVVEERDATIKSKDDEIAALKAQIAEKDAKLEQAERDKNEQNAMIEEQKETISGLEKQNRNYKVTVATLMGKDFNEAVKPLDVEEPENAKTL